MQAVIQSTNGFCCRTLSNIIKSKRRRLISDNFIRMSTGTDHLQRTASNTRQDTVSLATIIGVRDESKTVKGLTLKIHDKRFSFKAGQWVDTFIPGLEKVGGFSMCSSPSKLLEEGVLDLAVKRSDHPPAHWIHTQCKEGMEVQVRAGGDIYFDPKAEFPVTDVLLIAGGIGINPIYSILCHINDIQNYKGDNPVYKAGKVHLMYSASTADELIFQEKICKMAETHDNINFQYFITQEKSLDKLYKNGRITEEDLASIWNRLRKNKTMIFICGPSPMISFVETELLKAGVSKKLILYEKWW